MGTGALILFMFYVSSFMQAEAISIAKRNIKFQIQCLSINWTDHYDRSCNLTDFVVKDLDADPFRLNGTAFVENFKSFLDLTNLSETCFHRGLTLNMTFDEMNHWHVIHTSLNSSVGEGYSSTCSERKIHLYDATVENITDGCVVHPLGLSVGPCSSHVLKLEFDITAQLQILDGGSFNVASKSTQRSSTGLPNPALCSDISVDNDTKYDLHLGSDRCSDLRKFPPPTRCLDPNWNLYAWKKCSKIGFGLEVLYLDRRFDAAVFRDTSSTCREKLPAMDECLEANQLCTTPFKDNYDYYMRLRRSYSEICSSQTAFTSGRECMEKILQDENLISTYAKEVDRCSPTNVSGVCREYSKTILCNAYAQYVTNKTCTSFNVTYQYKMLFEDRNNAWQSCLSEKFDPCSFKEPSYDQVCSGPHLKVSVMMMILSTALLYLSGCTSGKL